MDERLIHNPVIMEQLEDGVAVQARCGDFGVIGDALQAHLRGQGEDAAGLHDDTLAKILAAGPGETPDSLAFERVYLAPEELDLCCQGLFAGLRAAIAARNESRHDIPEFRRQATTANTIARILKGLDKEGELARMGL